MPTTNISKNPWDPSVRVRGINVPDLPLDFPSSANIDDPTIPLPKVYTLKWTEPAATGNGDCDFPPSDEDLITLPDPQQHPALYNSAINTIRLSNDFFVKSGCVRVADLTNGYPKREWVEDLAEMFRKQFKEFIIPPDPRTLWVTDKNYHPADKRVPWENRLWVSACEKFSQLDDADKVEFLTKTNAERQKEYAGVFKRVDTYNEFLVNMFMTYLAHYECGVTNKDVDEQPHPTELDDFFAQRENQKGVTLYDLHRTFYKAKDIRELVRRVERFATYNPKPSRAFGQQETPEGAYFRKPIPSIAQIEMAITGPVTLLEIYENILGMEGFTRGIGSQKAVYDCLWQIAAPDVTTGLWIRKTKGPDESEVQSALQQLGPSSTLQLAAMFPNQVWSQQQIEDCLSGFAAPDFTTKKWILVDTEGPTDGDIQRAMTNKGPLYIDQMIGLFPNQVWSQAMFELELMKVAYQISEQDQRWLPLMLNPADGELIPEDDSRRLYALNNALEQNPLMVLDWLETGAAWDGKAYDYKPATAAISEHEQDTNEVKEQEDLHAGETTEEDEEDASKAVQIPGAKVNNSATPPLSPKRKRAMDEEQASDVQEEPERAIKKLRGTKGEHEHERCT